jgi:hypothetical protein
MPITRTGIEAALRAKGFRPYAEHVAESTMDASEAVGLENCWIDSYGDWVVRLGDNHYELVLDGDDEVVKSGDFAALASSLAEYEEE